MIHRWAGWLLLLLEWRVKKCIHHRGRVIVRYEPFAKIPGEVVVRRLGASLRDSADRVGEIVLHPQAWELLEDPRHARLGDRIVAPTAPVNADALDTQGRLGFLVETDRRGGVECNAVPDQLGPALIEALLENELPRGIRTFHLEPEGAIGHLRQSEVVQKRRNRKHFGIVGLALLLGQRHREQPGPHDMVEQIGFGNGAHMLDGLGYQRGVGQRDARKHARGTRMPTTWMRGRWPIDAQHRLHGNLSWMLVDGANTS